MSCAENCGCRKPIVNVKSYVEPLRVGEQVFESNINITSENYVKNALNTESEVTDAMIARISDPKTIRLLHAGMGLCTESAEFVDMLKKHIFYGKPLDLINLREEIGDSMWYIGIAIDVLNTTLNEVMTINIDKLKARYPEKFTEHHAINRDLKTERNILEGKYDIDFLDAREN